MEMIIGGAFQGKEAYALKRWPDRRFVSGKNAVFSELLTAGGILDLQAYIRNEVRKGTDLSGFAKSLIHANPDVVIVTDEIGYGIVPVDPEERFYRDIMGRICTALAEHSDKVTRIVSGIPQVIKDLTKELTIFLIRHGKTQGNLEQRYVGCRTEEPLCEEGLRELSKTKAAFAKIRNDASGMKIVYPERIFTSPMKRCLETSGLLFPGRKAVIVPDLRECDFGRFENHNYIELTGDPEYEAWIESGGTLPFPEGESVEDFRERCVFGFEKIVDECILEGVRSAAVIAHGGTIRNILCVFEKTAKNFYDWQIGNGEIFPVILVPSEWRKGLRFVEAIE